MNGTIISQPVISTESALYDSADAVLETLSDGFVYHMTEGIYEKTTSMIPPEQMFIVENLQDFFYTIKPKVGGNLFVETKATLSKKTYRVPDLAYFTREQIRRGTEGEGEIPSFAIEIISENDVFKDVEEKKDLYFSYGVQVVWWILPDTECVYVWLSPTDTIFCKGETICSAEKAVDNFALTANAIFRKQ
jgi:Uma2 family endonuclease